MNRPLAAALITSCCFWLASCGPAAPASPLAGPSAAVAPQPAPSAQPALPVYAGPSYQNVASWATSAMKKEGGFDSCLAESARMCLQNSVMNAVRAGAAGLDACDAIGDAGLRGGCRSGVASILSDKAASVKDCESFGDQRGACRLAVSLRLAAEKGGAKICEGLEAGTGAYSDRSRCEMTAALGAARRGEAGACDKLTGMDKDMCKFSVPRADGPGALPPPGMPTPPPGGPSTLPPPGIPTPPPAMPTPPR